jgi:hypothetical protein
METSFARCRFASVLPAPLRSGRSPQRPPRARAGVRDELLHRALGDVVATSSQELRDGRFLRPPHRKGRRQPDVHPSREPGLSVILVFPRQPHGSATASPCCERAQARARFVSPPICTQATAATAAPSPARRGGGRGRNDGKRARSWKRPIPTRQACTPPRRHPTLPSGSTVSCVGAADHARRAWTRASDAKFREARPRATDFRRNVRAHR